MRIKLLPIALKVLRVSFLTLNGFKKIEKTYNLHLSSYTSQMSSSLSVTKVENEINSVIFANNHTFKDINRWAQNNTNDWWHPLTSGQRQKYLANVRVGQILRFVYKSEEGSKTCSVKVVDVGSPQKYTLLENLYGPLTTSEWGHAYKDAIRVAKC
jgi:hypothetical protein